MIIKANETAAIIVDVQEKLMTAMYNREMVEENVNRLAGGLKLLEVPMIVTQQYTKGIGMTIPSVMETIGEGFSTWKKQALVFSATKQSKKLLTDLERKMLSFAVQKLTYVFFRHVFS